MFICIFQKVKQYTVYIQNDSSKYKITKMTITTTTTYFSIPMFKTAILTVKAKIKQVVMSDFFLRLKNARPHHIVSNVSTFQARIGGGEI